MVQATNLNVTFLEQKYCIKHPHFHNDNIMINQIFTLLNNDMGSQWTTACMFQSPSHFHGCSLFYEAIQKPEG